jgi:hypothetical protein
VAIFAAAWLLLGSAWGAGLMTAVIASMLVRRHAQWPEPCGPSAQ